MGICFETQYSSFMESWDIGSFSYSFDLEFTGVSLLFCHRLDRKLFSRTQHCQLLQTRPAFQDAADRVDPRREPVDKLPGSATKLCDEGDPCHLTPKAFHRDCVTFLSRTDTANM